MPALGERFREAREARNLSLSEVAEQIRIRSVYLAAIENENWPAIGAPIYVRGFLRTYARYLGLNPEEAVGAFNAATAEPSEAGDSEGSATTSFNPATGRTNPATIRPVPIERRNLSPLIWVAGLIAIALIAYVVYGALSLQHRTVATTSNPGAQNPAAAPGPSGTLEASSVPTATAPAQAISSPLPRPRSSVSPLPAVALGPHTISLMMKEPSWLRVTVDGSDRFEGIARAGSIRTFRGKSAVVRFGNAGGVVVTVDGKSIGTLGKPGDVVERAFTL